MEWIKTKDKLPDDDMQCIVVRTNYGVAMLVWNNHYKVWDDADGDDYCCDKDDVEFWMPIPNLPKKDK